MPDAILVQVADAVAAALNAEDFGTEFTAVRSYADWDMQLEDMGELHVDVVPVNSPVDLESVGSFRFDCSFDVGVRRRFDSSERDDDGKIPNANIDSLVKLTQDIATFFMPQQTSQSGRALTDLEDAAWSETEIKTIYSRRDLKEHHQYTGIVRTTYAVTSP